MKKIISTYIHTYVHTYIHTYIHTRTYTLVRTLHDVTHDHKLHRGEGGRKVGWTNGKMYTFLEQNIVARFVCIN